MKYFFRALKFLVAAFWLTIAFSGAHAANLVGLCPTETISQKTKIRLRAQVEEKLAESPTSAYHNYRLGVLLPEGVVPDIQVNQNLLVLLPVIHNRQVSARITDISGRVVRLLLTGQVQQLEGQVLTTEVPMKSEGLFLLPPQSIYSPRGHATKAFTVKENKARSVPVEVIQVMEDGQALVSSSQLKNENVICQGLNNLVDGETVEVIEHKGSSL